MGHMILLMLDALGKTIQGIHYIVCNVNRGSKEGRTV